MKNEMKIMIAYDETIININKRAKDLYDLHVEKDCLTLLKFGMLDYNIMHQAETKLRENLLEIYKEHLPEKTWLIDDFLKRVNHHIAVGIYSLTNMVV